MKLVTLEVNFGKGLQDRFIRKKSGERCAIRIEDEDGNLMVTIKLAPRDAKAFQLAVELSPLLLVAKGHREFWRFKWKEVYDARQ